MTAGKGEEVDTIHRVLNTYEAGEADALRRAADRVTELADRDETRAAHGLAVALAERLRVEADEIEKSPPPEPERPQT